MPLLRIAHEGTPDFDEIVTELERRGETDLERVEAAVREVLLAVRKEGDAAVRRYVEQFESRRVDRLVDSDYGGPAALTTLPSSVQDAMQEAARRIRRHHQRQL